MRLSRLYSVFTAALLLPIAGVAEDAVDPVPAEAPAAEEVVEQAETSTANAVAEEVAWDQFDDPEFDPAAADPTPAAGTEGEPGTTMFIVQTGTVRWLETSVAASKKDETAFTRTFPFVSSESIPCP